MRRSRVLVWCVLAGVGAFVTAGCSSGPPGGASGGPATLPSYATVDLDDLGAIPWGTYADASAEQKAQLTDGEVTYDEYKAAFGRMRACIQQRAGVDLSRPETVRATVSQLDELVTQLEKSIG